MQTRRIRSRTFILICSLASVFAIALAADAQDARQAKKELPAWKRGLYHDSVPVPTFSNIRYGDGPRNILDFWAAPSASPTPLVVVIHGGGWNGGAKEQINSFVETSELLEAGVSVAAIQYRLIKHSRDLSPPVKGPMRDAARALQFLRSKASEWNIDKMRIGATGGSAGACTSLWLAYHDDLADPANEDPVLRESTRLMCVAPIRGQTTLDPKQMKKWIPNSKYGAHAFGLASFDQFLAERKNILHWINEHSPITLLSPDDPPTYSYFPITPANGQAEKDPTHSATFGVKLHERCQEIGVPSELVYPGAPEVTHPTPTKFLIASLLNSAP